MNGHSSQENAPPISECGPSSLDNSSVQARQPLVLRRTLSHFPSSTSAGRTCFTPLPFSSRRQAGPPQVRSVVFRPKGVLRSVSQSEDETPSQPNAEPSGFQERVGCGGHANEDQQEDKKNTSEVPEKSTQNDTNHQQQANPASLLEAGQAGKTSSDMQSELHQREDAEKNAIDSQLVVEDSQLVVEDSQLVVEDAPVVVDSVEDVGVQNWDQRQLENNEQCSDITVDPEPSEHGEGSKQKGTDDQYVQAREERGDSVQLGDQGATELGETLLGDVRSVVHNIVEQAGRMVFTSDPEQGADGGESCSAEVDVVSGALVGGLQIKSSEETEQVVEDKMSVEEIEATSTEKELVEKLVAHAEEITKEDNAMLRACSPQNEAISSQSSRSLESDLVEATSSNVRHAESDNSREFHEIAQVDIKESTAQDMLMVKETHSEEDATETGDPVSKEHLADESEAIPQPQPQMNDDGGSLTMVVSDEGRSLDSTGDMDVSHAASHQALLLDGNPSMNDGGDVSELQQAGDVAEENHTLTNGENSSDNHQDCASELQRQISAEQAIEPSKDPSSCGREPASGQQEYDDVEDGVVIECTHL